MDDLTNVSRKILKNIRGEKSALALSQELGFSSNKIHRWENGHSKIYWDEFLNVCQYLKTYDQEQFQKLTHYRDDILDIGSLFNYFIGEDNIDSFLKEEEVSKSTYKKWIKKTSYPTAELIFRMFVFGSRTISTLIPVFSNLREVDLEGDLGLARERAALWSRYPYVTVVFHHIIQNSPFEFHQLAREMSEIYKVPVFEIESLILDLENLNIIERNEEELFSPVPGFYQRFSIAHNPDVLKTMIRATSTYSLEQLTRLEEATKNGLRIGTSEIILPKEGLEEFRELWTDCFNKLNALAKKYEEQSFKESGCYTFTSMLCRIDNQPVGPYYLKAREEVNKSLN